MSSDPKQPWLRDKLRHIAMEAAELPGLRLAGRPLYDRLFERAHRRGNTYRGVYASFEDARRAAPAHLPSAYEDTPAADIYEERAARITVSDYPLVYWLSRLLSQGATSVFDLGGHLGVSYRGFRNWIAYPPTLTWTVHDVPAVVAAGRAMVHADPALRPLAFSDDAGDADGQDVLVASGSLQYLDYTLPALLARLAEPPRHVLVNLTPMHDDIAFFTQQNMGKAVLPYRVSCAPTFIADMAGAGYGVVDRWRTRERSLRIPFWPRHGVDAYSGFCFARTDRGQQKTDGPARVG